MAVKRPYFSNPENARAAGRKGKGVPRKSKSPEWVNIGNKVNGAWAKHIITIMNRLMRKGEDREFFEKWEKLAPYFNAKLKQEDIKIESGFNVEVSNNKAKSVIEKIIEKN